MKYAINKTNKQQQSFSESKSGRKLEDAVAKAEDKFDEMKEKSKKFHDENPEITYGIGGALTGAGLGAIANLMLGDKKKSKLKKLLTGALYGAITGGALGVAGGGLVHKGRYKNLKDNYIHFKKPTKEDLLASGMTYGNWVADEQDRNSETALDPLLKVDPVITSPLLTKDTIVTESEEVKKLDQVLKSLNIGQ